MNYFLAIFVAGLLTACAVAVSPYEDKPIPEDKMQECLAEADAALKEHKPSELMVEVAGTLLEKQDTFESMTDVEKEINELLGGPITNDKGRQLIKDCKKFNSPVWKIMFDGPCGTWFGVDVDVYGKKRDQYLEGYDHLKISIDYTAVCDMLEDLEEEAASKV